MKVCVISDLHCKYQQNVDEYTTSLLISNKPRIPINQHPVSALLELIKENDITADILLCPGDLGDKADEQGILSGMAFLEEINRSLNSELLLTIPGNHDINSRKNLGKEPFAFIKSFHEAFPFSGDQFNSLFWDNGFCIIPFKESLYLMINTVHNHNDEQKSRKSIITQDALEKIERELKSTPFQKYKYKICVMHHHPIKHSNIRNWNDSDSVENGDKLLSILEQQNFNIVIHGHKHQPRIVEISSLPIFAAGSFSSFANLQGTGINTMFHIIEFDSNSKKGMIYSWEFDIISGWSQNSNKKFPPRIGFGASANIEQLASCINVTFEKAGKRPLFYDDVVQENEDLNFLIPDKLVLLGNILRTKYNIGSTPKFPLDPIRISEIIS